MENLPRDLAKGVDALRAPRPTRKPRRWTLLLMRDHGRVIRIGWFKWFVLLLVLLLVVAVGGASCLFVLYRRGRDVNAGLNRALAEVRQEIGELRKEKDILTARLAVARVEMDRLKAKTGSQLLDESAAQKGTAEMAAPGAATAPRGESGAAERPEKKTADNASAIAAARATAVVAVEELSISYAAAENIYMVRFLLKHTGPEADPVSGYTAVVLKAPDAAPDAFLALPPVELDAAGVPTGRKRGQYFSIARFKTVNSTAGSKIDPGRFNMATVFVFDTRKNLLLEKDYAIDIEKSVFTPRG